MFVRWCTSPNTEKFPQKYGESLLNELLVLNISTDPDWDILSVMLLLKLLMACAISDRDAGTVETGAIRNENIFIMLALNTATSPMGKSDVSNRSTCAEFKRR